MGQVQSVDENASHSHQRRRLRTKFVHEPTHGVRAGIRVPDRCRVATYEHTFETRRDALDPDGSDVRQTQYQATSVGTAQQESSARSAGALPGPEEEEDDAQFLGALKGLVDGAVKLLSADMGVGTWIVSGLLRKSGVVDSFVDSMVAFVNQRIGKLMEALVLKDAACAFALRLRRHVRAHDATTVALGICPGRRGSCRGKGKGPSLPGQGEDGLEKTAGGLEEHDVDVVQLWQAWKLCGGFWPPQMPDPDDPAFDGPEGTEDFLGKLDDGTQSFLREISQHVLETTLPEDVEELRAACGVRADGGDGGRGEGGDQSVIETANRLAQLKRVVLEPMLCQVLTQQVVGRFCRPGSLWQMFLQHVHPSADLSPVGHGLKHPETFSLVAGALERLGSTPASTLRMDLMQGLVKMAWGNREAGPNCRPTATNQAGGDAGSEGTSAKRQPTPASGVGDSTGTRERSGRGAITPRPKLESGGGESGHAQGGLHFPGSRTPPTAARGGSAGGARDIFSMPYAEQLSHGLVGGDEEDFYEELEELALQKLATFLQSEIVEKTPLAKCFLPESWVPCRVEYARALARRPTNLMLVLSTLDAAKDVLRSAGDRGNRGLHLNTWGNRTGAGGVVGQSGTTAVEPKQKSKEGDGYLEEMRSRAGSVKRGPGRRRRGSMRHTAGWRAWEARKEWFFAADVGIAAMHFGRSLLGAEAVRVGDAIIKAVSLDYSSVQAVVRHEAMNAIRKLSSVAGPRLLARIKTISTQPILYVSSQMRILRALKKAGLDFSTSLGDGPQKRSLSRRFKGYSWVFTDALIEKLVALKMREIAHYRAEAASTAASSHPESDGEEPLDGFEWVQDPHRGASSGGARWKDLSGERARLKGDVMRGITGCSSSKNLLVKVVGSWLPEVMITDMEAGPMMVGEARRDM